MRKGLAAGVPNKAVAYDLGISPRTIEVRRLIQVNAPRASRGKSTRMGEDADALAIARELIKRFGAKAVALGEERADAHRRVQENEGAQLWQHVADAARVILAGHARQPRASDFLT